MTQASPNPKQRTRDLLHRQIVEALLDDYSRQTNMPIGLFEKQRATFSALSSDVFSGFCKKFRENRRCLEACDRDHAQRALACATGQPVPQMCHVGLWNIGYPIIVDNNHIATLLAGQRLLEGQEETSKKRFLSDAKKLDLSDSDISRLFQYFCQTPSITEDHFKTDVFRHLQQTGGYLYQLAEHVIRLLQDRDALEHRTMIIAHEFLLPIQAIVADAANLIDEAKEGANCDLNFIQQASREVLDEMYKLGTLAENMRSSFLIKEPTRVEYKVHSIYRPLIHCWETYNAEAAAKRVILRKPYPVSGHFAQVEVSLPNLERAFMNIIGNAVKYSYTGSEIADRFIDILCSHDEEYCTVNVRNFGVGILPDEIASGKIWEAGYRGILSRDRSRVGSGLGLTEAKRVVCELHHGTIGIESLDKVSGYKTTVTVKLPLYQLRGEI